MATEIDYAGTVAAANTEHAANSILPDPLATLQTVADEVQGRKIADAALAAFVGAGVGGATSFPGTNTDDYTPNYSRSPAVSTPVLNGDDLETAVAKLNTFLNTHRVSPGVITAYYGTAASVTTLDGGSAGAITSNTGPFWAICDGTNSTPDLRGKFLVGASFDVGGAGDNTATYNVGQAGGESTHTLSTAEMPSHNHVATDGGHTHTLGTESGAYSTPNGTSINIMVDTSGTGSTGAHQFTNNGTGNVPYAAISRTDSGTANVTIANRGGGGAHENRPPYVGLYYIMRTARTSYS